MDGNDDEFTARFSNMDERYACIIHCQDKSCTDRRHCGKKDVIFTVQGKSNFALEYNTKFMPATEEPLIYKVDLEMSDNDTTNTVSLDVKISFVQEQHGQYLGKLESEDCKSIKDLIYVKGICPHELEGVFYDYCNQVVSPCLFMLNKNTPPTNFKNIDDPQTKVTDDLEKFNSLSLSEKYSMEYTNFQAQWDLPKYYGLHALFL